MTRFRGFLSSTGYEFISFSQAIMVSLRLTQQTPFQSVQWRVAIMSKKTIQVRDVESPFRRSRKAFSGPIIAFSGPIFALFGSDNCPFRPRSERAIIGPEKGNYRTRKGNYRTRKSQLSDPKRLIIGPEKAIIGGPEKAIIGPEKGNNRTKKGQLSDPKRPIIGPEKANYQTRKGQLYNCRLLQSSIKSSQ